MADYSADFNGSEPFFLNIWSKVPNYGFGFIVFHDFLRRVGFNKTFISTDFTPAGIKLFKKAQEAGLIEQVEVPANLGRYTRWKVVNDPNVSLESLKKQYK